jgi:hypothetical protein
MIVHKEYAQGSAEWYAAHLGKPTTSEFHKIITPSGEPSKQARAYMHRLIAERLLNESFDDPVVVEHMLRGKAEEPNAAAQFAFSEEVELETVGFVTDDENRVGCSPDRLIVGKPEALEIKCPAAHTHMGYLLDGPGKDYRAQVQGQLLIGEFEVVHFYSWHPRCPPVHIETEPDLDFLDKLERYLLDFIRTLDRLTEVARDKGTWVPSAHLVTPIGALVPPREPVQNVIE